MGFKFLPQQTAKKLPELLYNVPEVILLIIVYYEKGGKQLMWGKS